MKKLFLMAAVMCTAVAAQAVPSFGSNFSFNWSASGVYDKDGAEKSTLYSGTATLYAGDMAIATANMSNGDIQKSITEVEVAKGLTDFYYTMIDGDGAVFTSGTLSETVGPKLSYELSFSNTGSWSFVPEPTSGILLLVGLAGIALKRKRNKA